MDIEDHCAEFLWSQRKYRDYVKRCAIFWEGHYGKDFVDAVRRKYAQIARKNSQGATNDKPVRNS